MAGLPADLFERFQDYLNNEQELREVRILFAILAMKL